MAIYGNKKSGTIASEIRKSYLLRKRRLNSRHMKWLETLFAVQGEQRKVIRGNKLVDLSSLRPDDVDRIEVTHNYLFQSHKAMVASVLQADPSPVVALARPGMDGRQLARACERLLSYFYHDKQYKTSVHSAVSWAFITGVGFLGSVWDQLAAPPTWVPDVDSTGSVKYKTKKQLMVDENGGQMFSEYGTPLTEDLMVPRGKFQLLGDVRFWAPSPFDVFPTMTRDWADVRDVLMRQYVAHDDLVEMFGKKAKDLQTDVRSDDFVRFDDYDDPNPSNRDEDLVLVLSYYKKPDLANPDGKYCVVAGDTLLSEEKLPAKRLPMSPIYDTDHPTHLFGESSIRQALEAQRDLNAAEADLKMDRRMHAHPRLVAEQGSLVRGTTRVPNIPGAIMEVRPGAKFAPAFLTAPALPSWVERAPDRLQATIEDITGAHGLSKGQQGGIMSGRQASVVLSADRAKWTPTIRSLASAVERSSEVALMLWREYGPPEKTIDIYGSGTPTDVVTFYRDYIPDRIRVRIEVSAMQPYNEEIRRQAIMEMWQVGGIPDVRMLHKLLRHGEMGRLLGTDEPSRARARQEDELLDNGVIVNVESHEEHAAHLDEHLERMRDPSWYTLTPQAHQAYRMHVAQHDVFMQNAANPVLAGQSQMPQLPGEQSLQNLAPTMNGAMGQGTMPGVSPAQEAQYTGG